MSESIDCYLWMNSDWAYLGADRLDALARRHGATVRYMPVDLPAVYARTGGILLPLRAPERQRYRVAELRRWCRRLGIHVEPSPKFMCPDATLASRIVIAAGTGGPEVVALYKAILRAEWCEERDISNPRTLADIVTACGLDAQALMQRAHTDDVARTYGEFTDRAVAAGVFGSPSYVYRGELFWGQDRLDFLEEAVLRRLS
ncbi:2-hydroxychromene-2-carboxylate isomerase [Variovorax sp. E3]|uniref:2-hydroxychromene-2-carboxylate isomerase n=1 Tax=Variovorax sp. E3 TaxID=1914993 RepID=UPI0018DC8C08|nr:2-hydroxychromene-2-carboxylate isomerase [Variovorax sp. E3]